MRRPLQGTKKQRTNVGVGFKPAPFISLQRAVREQPLHSGLIPLSVKIRAEVPPPVIRVLSHSKDTGFRSPHPPCIAVNIAVVCGDPRYSLLTTRY